MSSAKAFTKIGEEFFNFLLRESPTTATYLGIHNRDTQLTSWAKEDVQRRRKEIKRFINQLSRINPNNLYIEDRVDYELLLGNLRTWELMGKKLPSEKCQPSSYLDFGLYVLTEREFASPETRAVSILGRLKKIPKVLKQAEENLENPPRIFTESAILATQGQIAFMEKSLRKFLKRVRGEENKELREEIKTAIDKAVSACKDYANFLEKDLLKRSKGNYAVGKGVFNFLLKNEHFADINADDLLAFGKRNLAKIKRELAETAKEINFRKSWERIVDELKKDHPSNDELVEYYEKEMKRAKEFVKRKGLITFPAQERLKVVETPEYAKPFIPYAAYIPPAPFEKDKLGIFWVTTAPSDAPKRKVEEQLKGHPKAGIVITALHEAYPGHHLQLSIAGYHPDKLRHLLHTSVFVEGWALYCEELMWREGFYDDPRCRLLQLKDALWRASRVIIDVSLHTNLMTFDQAVKFLVKEAKLEEVNAITEVRRYCHSPTQPISYLLGKIEIEKLLQEYKRAKGASFEVRRFHDELLSFGSIPIKHIKRLMGLAER